MHRYCISRWIGWTWEWMGRGGDAGEKSCQNWLQGQQIGTVIFWDGESAAEIACGANVQKTVFFFFLVMLSVWYWLGIRVETVIRQLAEHTSLKSRKRVWIGGIYLWFIGNRNICSPHPLPPKNNDWVWKRKFPKTEHWAFQCLEVLIRRT